jgi:hypothetical protein
MSNPPFSSVPDIQMELPVSDGGFCYLQSAFDSIHWGTMYLFRLVLVEITKIKCLRLCNTKRYQRNEGNKCQPPHR